MSNNNPFTQFELAESEEQLNEFREAIQEQGFTGFRQFLDGFKEKLKRFEDPDQERMEQLLDRAKKLFPEPGKFSPSWEKVWDDFEQMISFKRFVFETVAMEDREGEWQVIIDNPYTHQEIVCYPGLDFIDGAFLYAYFRTDLKQNEYIRLQKIQNVIMAFGRDGSGHSDQEKKEKSKERE